MTNSCTISATISIIAQVDEVSSMVAMRDWELLEMRWRTGLMVKSCGYVGETRFGPIIIN